MDFRRRTQHAGKGMDEQIAREGDYEADDCLKEHAGVEGLKCLLPVRRGKSDRDENAGAGCDCHAQGNQQFHGGNGGSGGGQGAAAQTRADEYAVHDHVYGIEQKSDHLRNGIPEKNLSCGFLKHMSFTS